MEMNSPESGFNDINDLLKDNEAPFPDLDLGFVMEENTAHDYIYDGFDVNDTFYSKTSDQEKQGPTSLSPSCRYYNTLRSPDIYSSAQVAQREFSYETLGEKEIDGDAGNSRIQYDETVEHEDSELYDSYLHDSIFQIDSETILNDINNDVSAHSEGVVSIHDANTHHMLDKSTSPVHGEVIAEVMQNKQAQSDSAQIEAVKEVPVAQMETPAAHLGDPQIDTGNINQIKKSSSVGEVFDPSHFCLGDNVTSKEVYGSSNVHPGNIVSVVYKSTSPVQGEDTADPVQDNLAHSESVPREMDEVSVAQSETSCNPSDTHLGYHEMQSGNTNENGNSPSGFEEFDPSLCDPRVNGMSMELYRTLCAHSEDSDPSHAEKVHDVYGKSTSSVQGEVISDATRNKQVQSEDKTETFRNPSDMKLGDPAIDNGDMSEMINSLSEREMLEPSHSGPEDNPASTELYRSPNVREEISGSANTSDSYQSPGLEKSSGLPQEHQVTSDSNRSITQTPFPNIEQDEHQIAPDEVMGQSPTFCQKENPLARDKTTVSECILELPSSKSDESNKHCDFPTHESHSVEPSWMKCSIDLQGPNELSSSPSKTRKQKRDFDENSGYESQKVSALQENEGRSTSSKVSKKRYASEEMCKRKRRRSSAEKSPSTHQNSRSQNFSLLEENLMEPLSSGLVMENDESAERADRNKRFGSNDYVGRRHSLRSSAKYSPAPPDKYSSRHENRHRRRSRSQSRRKEFSSGYKRGNHDRYHSRSPRRRLRSPRVRFSRSRSPLGHQSLRNAPRRSHWSPPHNRSTGIGKPGRNLFIAGFNFITTERDLERKFSRFGRVRNVRIVRDKRSGDSRGFGFLTLEKDEQADAAIRALDKSEWGGRIVLVEKTKPHS